MLGPLWLNFHLTSLPSVCLLSNQHKILLPKPALLPASPQTLSLLPDILYKIHILHNWFSWPFRRVPSLRGPQLFSCYFHLCPLVSGCVDIGCYINSLTSHFLFSSTLSKLSFHVYSFRRSPWPQKDEWQFIHITLSIKNLTHLIFLSSEISTSSCNTEQAESGNTRWEKKHRVKIEMCFNRVSLLNINLKGLRSLLSNLFPMSGVLWLPQSHQVIKMHFIIFWNLKVQDKNLKYVIWTKLNI